MHQHHTPFYLFETTGIQGIQEYKAIVAGVGWYGGGGGAQKFTLTVSARRGKTVSATIFNRNARFLYRFHLKASPGIEH